MPKIPAKLDWFRTTTVLKQPVQTVPTLRLLIPAALVKRLGWKGEESVNLAEVYEDVLLIWKEKNEPELSLLSRAKITPDFEPITEQKMEHIVRDVVSGYVLGAGSVEIIPDTSFSVDFISALEEEINEELGLRAPFPLLGMRVVIPISPPLDSFTCLKNMYNETLVAVTEIMELLVKGGINSDTFDKSYKTVRLVERNCDYWKRAILRDIEVNKLDRIDDLPYIATIPKYLEPVSDHARDIMEHIKRLGFEIPAVVSAYAGVFKERILDKGYFINPYPEEEYKSSYLHDAIDECIKLEREESRKAMETLEQSTEVEVKRVVHACFLVSRLSGICRNLHNIAEIKFDWQNSAHLRRSTS
ncbi:MAG: hypothetical protein EFT35_04265 [Methanophagales archaeon ANME-1-THS]|nr:MAG: hypothetical protein EFT35_04265 [Methanophagales archaeon ANME-1-THS]